MESLLTVRARRERGGLRMVTVDVDKFRTLAEAFGIADIPTLVLLCDRQPVARIDGKATASQIDAMLESHLPDGNELRIPHRLQSVGGSEKSAGWAAGGRESDRRVRVRGIEALTRFDSLERPT
jgi:thioredoxin-like negative regulator of GroEL